MDPKELFARSVGQTTGCLRHLDSRQLDNPTPCSQWNVRQLLNHMVYELRWAPDMLNGKTVEEVGDRYEGDLLGTDVKNAWQHAVDAALVAIKHVDPDQTVHLSYAAVPAKNYIAELGGDMLVHTWDLEQGMNCSLMMETDLAQTVYENTLPRKDEFAKTGMYGTPTDAPDDASIQTKLLALFGRQSPEIS